MLDNLLRRIHWLGHASFRIQEDPVVYIDPWKVASRALTARLVLITHGHYDHLSRQDIERVRGSQTTVIMPPSAAATFGSEAVTLGPGDTYVVDDVTVTAVAAYNMDKAFHPKDNDWLGYHIQYPDGSIYHAGDTDLIPEMNDVRADIALLPIGGTYTMNADDAVEAALRVHASIVIPMHWGDVVGVEADARRFEELAKERGLRVVMLYQER